MTEEQIKQKAREYLANLDRSGVLLTGNEVYLAYIAGAHSRDEEIGRMNTTIRLYANHISQLREELDQLCNPWVSVKNNLPDPHTPVYAKNDKRIWFFALRTDNIARPWYDIVGRHSEEVTHWKPISELKEGE